MKWSDKSFVSLVDSLSDCLVIIDCKCTVKHFNKAAEMLFGFDHTEILGRNIKILMAIEDQEKHDQYITAYISGHGKNLVGKEVIEVQVVHKDGSIVDVALSISDWHLEGRKYLVVVFRDLSASKKNERKILELTEFRTMLFNEMPVGLVLSRTNGEILEFNEYFERLIGLSRKNIFNLKTWVNLLEGGKDFVKKVNQFLLSGASFGPLERRLNISTSDFVPVRINGRMILEGNEPVVVSSVEDVTSEYHAEIVEERLAWSQKVAAIGNWEWNIEKNKLWLSTESYRIIDIDPSDFGATYEAFLGAIHPHDRELMRTATDEALNRKKEYKLVHRVAMPSGEERHVSMQGAVEFSGGGEPLRMIGTLQDITENINIKRKLEQSQKMEIVGLLAGGIAHDFNNILAIILGNLELIEGKLQNPEDIKLLEKAKEALLRGGSLTQRLLSYSRIQHVLLEAVDVNRVINELYEFVGRIMPETIEFKLDLTEGLWCCEADSNQVENVILNLIVNARDAMPGGGVLTVTSANKVLSEKRSFINTELSSGKYLMVSVRDLGHGIPQEKLRKIFDPFYTTKEVGKGTGLGLSMVYDFVKSLNGAICVNSCVGEGSEFEIWLPKSDREIVKNENLSEGYKKKGQMQKILVVEDDDELRELVASMLEANNYIPIEVSNGANALTRLREDRANKISAIISDITMPGHVSGVDLAKQIKILKPGIKILLISGYVGDSINRTEIDIYSDAFLNKPFHVYSILRSLSDILKPCA